MRIVSWNIRRLEGPWRQCAADQTLDLALLQEARVPPKDVLNEIIPSRDESWTIPGCSGPSRTAIVKLSDRIEMRALPTHPLATADSKVLRVSWPGTLTAAEIRSGAEVFLCISVYSLWQNVVSTASDPWIIADASAHRLISDISTLITREKGHRIIVAGDWNLLRGYGENGSQYWAKRYATVFTRMESLGFRCLGPDAPNGRQAEPWPTELPPDSLNVPTYCTARQTPRHAARQLDYVFASESIAERIRVCALNEVDQWGPSDHCRLAIEVQT